MLLHLKKGIEFDEEKYTEILKYLDAFVISHKLEEKHIGYYASSPIKIAINLSKRRSDSPSSGFSIFLPNDNIQSYIFKISIDDSWIFNGRLIRKKLLQNDFKNYHKKHVRNYTHHYTVFFDEPSDIIKLINVFTDQLTL